MFTHACQNRSEVFHSELSEVFHSELSEVFHNLYQIFRHLLTLINYKHLLLCLDCTCTLLVKLREMTGFDFAIIFCIKCLLFPCTKGTIFSSNGTNVTVTPGSTERIVWSFDDKIESFTTQLWTFIPSNGQGLEGLAEIRGSGDAQKLTSLYDVAVEKPATLVLKNVNLTYNGTYRFTLPSSSPSEVVVNIAVKPTATACSSRIMVNESGNVSCACQGQGGNPPADVTWYDKDGRKVGETGKEEKTLVLTNVSEKHRGSYKCVAQSYPSDLFRDNVIVEVIVNLNYKPTKPDITLPDKNVAFLGEEFTIRCVADGLPEPSYMITHNGSLVSNEPTYSKLTEWDDAGVYTCNATNKLGTNSSSATLIVQAALMSVNCPSASTVNATDDFTCVCTALGRIFTADVTWYKENKKIGKTGKGKQTLRLINVGRDDAGKYKCEANSHDTAIPITEIQLIVNYPPENAKLTLTKIGNSATVECSAEAQPPANFRIYRNENKLVKSNKTYTIPEVCNSHVGDYTCVADNILGNVSSNSEYLSIQDKASSSDTSRTEWYVVVVTLVAGIIIGILFSYIVSCSRRKFGSRKPQSCPEPRACEADSTYQELDLTKMNAEDNYQSLRVNAASNVVNEDDSNYSELSKTRDVENSYQSLT